MQKNLLIVILITLNILTLSGCPKSANLTSITVSYLPGWDNRIILTIDHTKIESPLDNFPVLVHLSTASGINQADVSSIFKTLGHNQRKIAVSAADGTTQCHVEIEKWDSTSMQAWLWVLVPTISNSEDTILYLYWDENQPDNDAFVGNTGSVPAQKVWSNGFVMVHHLNQNSNGTTGEFIDSTDRQNNGTGFGIPTLKSGKVGDAQFFDGDDDYITIPDSDDLSLSTTWELTVSWWFGPTVLNWRKANGTGDYINMLGKGGYPGGWEWVFGLGLQNSKNKPQQINLYHHNPPGGMGIGAGTSVPYKAGEWIYVVGRFNDKNVDILNFYPSGLKTSTNIYNKATGYSDAITPQNTWAPLCIGTILTQWQMYEGLIDEVRISNVYRSDAWIKANYHSENDDLININLSQSSPPASTAASPSSSIMVQSATPSPSDYGGGITATQWFIYIGLVIFIAAIAFLLWHRRR